MTDDSDKFSDIENDNSLNISDDEYFPDIQSSELDALQLKQAVYVRENDIALQSVENLNNLKETIKLDSVSSAYNQIHTDSKSVSAVQDQAMKNIEQVLVRDENGNVTEVMPEYFLGETVAFVSHINLEPGSFAEKPSASSQIIAMPELKQTESLNSEICSTSLETSSEEVLHSCGAAQAIEKSNIYQDIELDQSNTSSTSELKFISCKEEETEFYIESEQNFYNITDAASAKENIMIEEKVSETCIDEEQILFQFSETKQEFSESEKDLNVSLKSASVCGMKEETVEVRKAENTEMKIHVSKCSGEVSTNNKFKTDEIPEENIAVPIKTESIGTFNVKEIISCDIMVGEVSEQNILGHQNIQENIQITIENEQEKENIIPLLTHVVVESTEMSISSYETASEVSSDSVSTVADPTNMGVDLERNEEEIKSANIKTDIDSFEDAVEGIVSQTAIGSESSYPEFVKADLNNEVIICETGEELHHVKSIEQEFLTKTVPSEYENYDSNLATSVEVAIISQKDCKPQKSIRDVSFISNEETLKEDTGNLKFIISNSFSSVTPELQQEIKVEPLAEDFKNINIGVNNEVKLIVESATDGSIIEHSFEKQQGLVYEKSSDETFTCQGDSKTDFTVNKCLQNTVKENEINKLPNTDPVVATCQHVVQISETMKTDIVCNKNQDEIIVSELQNDLTKIASFSEAQISVVEPTKTMPIVASDSTADSTLQKIIIIESCGGISSLEETEQGTSDPCEIVEKTAFGDGNKRILPKCNTEETEIECKSIEEHCEEGFMEHKDQIPTHLNDFNCIPILERTDTFQCISEADATKSVSSDLYNISVNESESMAAKTEVSEQELTVKKNETVQCIKESFTGRGEDNLLSEKCELGISFDKFSQIKDASLNHTDSIQELNRKRAELLECHEYAKSVELDLVGFNYSEVPESLHIVPPCSSSEELHPKPSDIDETSAREVEFQDSVEVDKRRETGDVKNDRYKKEYIPMHEKLLETSEADSVVDFKFNEVLESLGAISPCSATEELLSNPSKTAPSVREAEFKDSGFLDKKAESGDFEIAAVPPCSPAEELQSDLSETNSLVRETNFLVREVEFKHSGEQYKKNGSDDFENCADPSCSPVELQLDSSKKDSSVRKIEFKNSGELDKKTESGDFEIAAIPPCSPTEELQPDLSETNSLVRETDSSVREAEFKDSGQLIKKVESIDFEITAVPPGSPAEELQSDLSKRDSLLREVESEDSGELDKHKESGNFEINVLPACSLTEEFQSDSSQTASSVRKTQSSIMEDESKDYEELSKKIESGDFKVNALPPCSSPEELQSDLSETHSFVREVEFKDSGILDKKTESGNFEIDGYKKECILVHESPEASKSDSVVDFKFSETLEIEYSVSPCTLSEELILDSSKIDETIRETEFKDSVELDKKIKLDDVESDGYKKECICMSENPTEIVESDSVVDFKFSEVPESTDVLPFCSLFEKLQSDSSRIDEISVRKAEFKDSMELRRKTTSNDIGMDRYKNESISGHEDPAESPGLDLLVDFKFSEVIESTYVVSPCSSSKEFKFDASRTDETSVRETELIDSKKVDAKFESDNTETDGYRNECVSVSDIPESDSVVDFKFSEAIESTDVTPVCRPSEEPELNPSKTDEISIKETEFKECMKMGKMTESGAVDIDEKENIHKPESPPESSELDSIVDFKFSDALVNIDAVPSCSRESDPSKIDETSVSETTFKDFLNKESESDDVELDGSKNEGILMHRNPPDSSESDLITDFKFSSFFEKSASYKPDISVPGTLISEPNLPEVHAEEMKIILPETDDSSCKGIVEVDTDKNTISKEIDVCSDSMKIFTGDSVFVEYQNIGASFEKTKDVCSTDEEANDLSYGILLDSYYNASSVSEMENQTSDFCTVSDDISSSVDDFTDVPSHLTLTEDSDRWSDVEADLSASDTELVKDIAEYNLEQNDINKSSVTGEINLTYELQQEFQGKYVEIAKDENESCKTKFFKTECIIPSERSAADSSSMECTPNFPSGREFQQNIVSDKVIESKMTGEAHLDSGTLRDEISSDNLHASRKLTEGTSDILQIFGSETSVVADSRKDISFYQGNQKESGKEPEYYQDISSSFYREEKAHEKEFTDPSSHTFVKNLQETLDDVSTGKTFVGETISDKSAEKDICNENSEVLSKQDTEKNQLKSIEKMKVDPALLVVKADTTQLHETLIASELTHLVEETLTSEVITERTVENLETSDKQVNFLALCSESSDLSNTKIESEKTLYETSISTTVASSDEFTDMSSQHILTEDSEQWSDVESDIHMDDLEGDIKRESLKTKLYFGENQSKVQVSDDSIIQTDHTCQSDAIVSHQTHEVLQQDNATFLNQMLNDVTNVETSKMDFFDDQSFIGTGQIEHSEEAVSDSLRSEQIFISTSAQDLSHSAVLVDTSLDRKLLEHFADIKSLNEQLSVAEPFIPPNTEMIVPQKQEAVDVSSTYLEKTDNSDYWLEADTDYSISEFGEESASVSDKQNCNQVVAEAALDDKCEIITPGIDASVTAFMSVTDTSISSFYTDPENSDQVSDTCADISLQGATTENSDRVSDIEIDDILHNQIEPTGREHEDKDQSQLTATLYHIAEESKILSDVHDKSTKSSESKLKFTESISLETHVSDMSDLTSANLAMSSSENDGKFSDIQQISDLTASTSILGIFDDELTNVTPFDVEDSDKFSDKSDNTSLDEIESEIFSLKCHDIHEIGASHLIRDTISQDIPSLSDKDYDTSDGDGVEKLEIMPEILFDCRGISSDVKSINDEHTSSESAQGARTETSHDEFTDISSVSLKEETSNEEYADVKDKPGCLSNDHHEASVSHDTFSDVITHLSTSEVPHSVGFLKNKEESKELDENEISELYDEFVEIPSQTGIHMVFDSDVQSNYRKSEIEFRKEMETRECVVTCLSETDELPSDDLSSKIYSETGYAVNEEEYFPDAGEFDESIKSTEMDQDELYVLENERFEISEDEFIYPLQYDDWVERSFDLKEYGIEAALSECESDVHGFGVHEEYDDEDIQRAIDLNITNFEEEGPTEEVPFSTDSFKTLSSDVSPYLKVTDKEQDSWSTADAPSIEEEDLSEHDDLLLKIDKLLAEDFTFDEYHKRYEEVGNDEFLEEKFEVDVQEKQESFSGSETFEKDSKVFQQSQTTNVNKINLKDSKGAICESETSDSLTKVQITKYDVDQTKIVTENTTASETIISNADQIKSILPNDVLSTFPKLVENNVEQQASVSVSETSGEAKLTSEQQSILFVKTNISTPVEENISNAEEKGILSFEKPNTTAHLPSDQPTALHKGVAETKHDIPFEKFDSFADEAQKSLIQKTADYSNSFSKKDSLKQEEEMKHGIPCRTEVSTEWAKDSDKALKVSEINLSEAKAVVSKEVHEEEMNSSDYKPHIPSKTKCKLKSLETTTETLKDGEQSDKKPALPPKKSKRSSSLHSSSSAESLSSSSESLSSFESAASKISAKMDTSEGIKIIPEVPPDIPAKKSKSFSRRKSEESDDSSISSSSSSFSYRGRKKAEQTEWGDLSKKRPSIDERMIKLQNEGKCANKEKAFIAAKLIEMQFEEEDALMASRQCNSVYHAVKFLTQLCELCNCRFPINLMASMFHCTHRACKECLKAHFTSLIYDRSIFTLLCPVCFKPDITDQNIQEYFNHLDMMLRNILDSKVYDLFQRKLRDEVLTKDPNFHWCSQCSSGFIASPRLKKLYCPDCSAVTCASCHQTWELEHEGVHCERFQQWKDMHTPEPPPAGLVKLLADRGITCPSCGIVYAQACGGCLMYKCSHCSFEFCGFCQRPIKRGKECGNKICESRGIHAHHPSNCLFYVRDADMSDIQILLQEESVEYLTIPPKDQIVKSRCQVREQKHIHGVISEDRCGRDIEPYCAGLCRTHYFEYLAELLRKHKISPLPIMTVQDLQLMLRKSRIPVPEKVKGENTNEYYDRLTKAVTSTLT
ncbi:RING finger protein 31, partial [Stegodyphus mimosarum]